jgi:hypothetical protein
MPLYSTKFHISWFKKFDSDGISVKQWLKQGTSPLILVFTICKTDELSCENKGWQSIERHMNNKKHLSNLKLLKKNFTFIIRSKQALNQHQQGSSSSTVSIVTLADHTKNISFTDQVTRAETLWTINAARYGYSYQSCDDLDDLFRTIFPNSKIAEHYKMERTN